MQVEARPARALVAVAVGVLRADVAEEPGEQRLVDRAVARGVDRRRELRLPSPAQLGELVRELRVDVAPFGEPQVRHELRAARVDEPPVRELLGEPRAEELPQREEREEIGALVAEQPVRLVGRLLLRERTIARIGDRQRARDHEHLGRAVAVARGDDHPADARIDRQPRELAPERRQCAQLVDRAQLLQQLEAVGDRARRRRLDERERVDGRSGPAPPCAGSPPRASCAGSRGRCTAAARRSRPRRRGARRCPRRRARSVPRAGSPRPARSSRSAAASSCCAASSA